MHCAREECFRRVGNAELLNMENFQSKRCLRSAAK